MQVKMLAFCQKSLDFLGEFPTNEVFFFAARKGEGATGNRS
jgi:hypothetical protein